MKLAKMVFVNVLVVTMLIANSLICFAASGEVSISIYPNQVWTADSDNTDSRSTNYSTVYARNHSVRPISGIDLFSTIQARVTNGYAKVISDSYSLSESASGNTDIKLFEGNLGTTLVGFQFRGNSSSAAYAIVSYDGR